MNPSNGTFSDVVLIFQPLKEAGKYPTHVIDGYLARLPATLKIRQVRAYVVGRNRSDRFRCVGK